MSNNKEMFRYPFAASPDIIRSNQKDAYFQGVLLEQLSAILRKFYGARFAHSYTSEARVFTELLYLGLTTLVGNRTLGEEYCDMVQVENDTLRLPSIARRAAYILGTILFPYSLNRCLPSLRRFIRARLEANLRKTDRKGGNPASRTVQSYILSHLDTITSPSPIYAVSLAVFYFSGAYYHIGKRLAGLRYIFTRRVEQSEQRAGYEVLGVLLVLQLAVQTYLHMHHTMTLGPPASANTGLAAGTSAVLDGGVEVSLDPNAYSSNNALLFEARATRGDVGREGVGRIAQTEVLEGPRYDLTDSTAMSWIQGRQQRKCTLCLEPLKDPSVTTCGHVFCWTCIADWIREKPECPLCRQECLVQHVLPLRG